MHTGSCLCGAVEYEIDSELGVITLCHCSRCRKASGSAFGAVMPVAAKDFRVVKGQGALRSFTSDGGVERVFCGECGSPIIGKRAAMPDVVRVRVGTLDEPEGTHIGSHIFVGSKACWYEIADDVPQHVERPM
ncbi:GFA family protein [Chitinimonas naiadis]